MCINVLATSDPGTATELLTLGLLQMSNAGRQLPQEAEERPELETEILDPSVQARSDRPTDPAAAEQLSSPNLDLQDPGMDFRRDAFELQQTDDVSTQEDSAQALVSIGFWRRYGRVCMLQHGARPVKSLWHPVSWQSS